MNGTGYMIILTPIKEYIAPGFVMVHHGELIGIIEVNFHHQTVGYLILGHRVIIHRLVNIGIRALHNQTTARIISSGGTHGINEGLFIFQDNIYCRCSNVPLVLLSGFVTSGKEQVLVISIQFIGNLCPDSFLLGIYFAAVTMGDTLFKPTAIPMDIDNGIHIIGYTVAHHFAHPVEPCSIYLIGRWIHNVVIPRARDAHRIKSQCLQPFDICLTHFRISP